MKKNKVKKIIMILVAICIGCFFIIISKDKNTKDSKNSYIDEVCAENEEVTAAYGVEVKSLKYEGDNICMDIFYDNGPVDCEVGVKVFVNGIEQIYSDYSKSEESNMLLYKLKKNTQKKLS